MKEILISSVLSFVFLLMAQYVEAGSIKGKVTIRGLKSPTVVYLKDVPGDFPPPEEHAVMDQKELKFVPYVLPILKGATVDFPNSDTVRHNVFSPPGSAKVFDLGTYDVGAVKSVTFDVTGETPLLCNVHAEMSGYVVSLQNPYFCITDETGTYTIEDVPPGKYTLTTWNERLKAVTEDIDVKDGETTNVVFTLNKRR